MTKYDGNVQRSRRRNTQRPSRARVSPRQHKTRSLTLTSTKHRRTSHNINITQHQNRNTPGNDCTSFTHSSRIFQPNLPPSLPQLLSPCCFSAAPLPQNAFSPAPSPPPPESSPAIDGLRHGIPRVRRLRRAAVRPEHVVPSPDGPVAEGRVQSRPGRRRGLRATGLAVEAEEGGRRQQGRRVHDLGLVVVSASLAEVHLFSCEEGGGGVTVGGGGGAAAAAAAAASALLVGCTEVKSMIGLNSNPGSETMPPSTTAPKDKSGETLWGDAASRRMRACFPRRHGTAASCSLALLLSCPKCSANAENRTEKKSGGT